MYGPPFLLAPCKGGTHAAHAHLVFSLALYPDIAEYHLEVEEGVFIKN